MMHDFNGIKPGDKVRVVREFVVDEVYEDRNDNIYSFDDIDGSIVNNDDDTVLSVEVLGPALPTDLGSFVTFKTLGGPTQAVLTGNGWVALNNGNRFPASIDTYQIVSIDRVGV